MSLRSLLFLAAIHLAFFTSANASYVWIEGENPASTNIQPHPWYSGQINKSQLSGGGFIAHFDGSKLGVAEYQFSVPSAGDYTFWLRANPTQTSLNYSLNGARALPVSFRNIAGGVVNLASDDKPDLRFIGWVEIGRVKLQAGQNRIRFTMDSTNANHGAIDCFLFTDEPFSPSGTLKPEQLAAAASRLAVENAGWFPWNPPTDDFAPSPIDLRPLNEKFAGENGRIIANGDEFVHSATGRSVRFWAVNGPAAETPAELARSARLLAKYGVNLVRHHAAPFDNKTGALKPDGPELRARIVDAMKAEGIYTHLSIYFPLWLKPASGPGWREGYDGTTHPFALLFFEPEFQQLYRDWWKSILTARTPSGVALIDEPALMGIELLNEDSFFFWTFSSDNIPAPQLRKLEHRFGKWAARKYGSIASAQKKWDPDRLARDDVASGRLGFRSLYDITTRKTLRDQDTVAFLYELQRGFYADTVTYLRGLGYKGLITASNWTTADNRVLGPVEKLSYLPGDFIDHHGYWSSNHKGPDSSWSIRAGHTYSDVSALRFDDQRPGAPSSFTNPVMDPMYDSRPSMISEIAWNRPNRHRSEAPLFLAAYGALQGTDAIVHFAFDSQRWDVKPHFFAQPWNLMAPSQMGQFTAAAFIYRQGLLRPGELMAEVSITPVEALALQGTPLVQSANLDELRKADLAGNGTGNESSIARIIDPLIHFVGRTNMHFAKSSTPPMLKDLAPFIDRRAQTVLSSTRELRLDYGKGVLALNAPSAQGLSGDLAKAGRVALNDVEIESPLEVGHIVAVALDGRPLATSTRILIQVMSEEKPTGFTTEPAGNGVHRITDLGRDPWLVREFAGQIAFKRPDAARLRVTALDFNGRPVERVGTAVGFKLRRDVAYYIVTP